MPSLYALAASLSLFVPMLGHANVAEQVSPVAGVDALAAPQCKAENAQSVTSRPAPLPILPREPGARSPLSAFYEMQNAQQVRIQQRVTIRISPYRRGNPNSLLARLPTRGRAQTFQEREMSGCVPVSGIAGVQTGTGNRLLLFLRDQRIVSLNLERACRARDFYSGFYIERNEDGNLCVDRDELQSRSGAKCEVERMRQLVAVGD